MKPATSRRLRLARASIVVSVSAALAACVSVGPDFTQPGDALAQNQGIAALAAVSFYVLLQRIAERHTARKAQKEA
ncbi:hypothetical protein [Burkholderia sp. WSM2230]|uniref:hypothetical protein n=1 Tax=Burkholderia sp. WSM2230 TaxID=944435 RepID=UPI00046F16A8|nr:hypothetical protein [Burkholderia sp. WSM2230]